MLQPEMVLETVEIMRQAVEKGITVNVIVNNRAGGNAPYDCPRDCKKIFAKPETFSRESIESGGSLIISKVSHSDEFWFIRLMRTWFRGEPGF